MSTVSKTFLGCDWGTSVFRLRLIEWDSARVVAQTTSAYGTRRIAAELGEGYEDARRARLFSEVFEREAVKLCDHAELPTLPTWAVISGMASSSVGWLELPYADLPFPLDGTRARTQRIPLTLSNGHPIQVFLVSGVASESEMMRGEETQILGLLNLPDYSDFATQGLVVLPGTHSKHTRVTDRNVVSLQTFMTGELFAVLCQHSLLAFTCSSSEDDWDDAAFVEGVESARANGVMRSLFQARARGVLGGRSQAANRSYLSGLLIGAEWAASVSSDFHAPILLAASPKLEQPYARAATVLGFGDRLTSVPSTTLELAETEGHRLLSRLAGACG